VTSAIRKTTRAEYDAIDADNFSSIKHIEKSPAHYLHRKQSGDDEDTDARIRGRVTHWAIFEPQRWQADVASWHGVQRRGKQWDEFRRYHLDHSREIVTDSMHAEIEALASAIRSSPQVAPYLAKGQAETTVTWEYCFGSPKILPSHCWSANCKGRLDFISEHNGGAILDLKTTFDASPDAFGRTVFRNDYHVQAAFYVDGVRAATGRELPFIFIAAEASAPYVVQAYRVPEEVLELGREKYRGWLQKLHECRTRNQWHGYAATETELVLPRWAMPSEEGIEDMGLTFNGEET
jgi:hypothetical protein